MKLLNSIDNYTGNIGRDSQEDKAKKKLILNEIFRTSAIECSNFPTISFNQSHQLKHLDRKMLHAVKKIISSILQASTRKSFVS